MANIPQHAFTRVILEILAADFAAQALPMLEQSPLLGYDYSIWAITTGDGRNCVTK